MILEGWESELEQVQSFGIQPSGKKTVHSSSIRHSEQKHCTVERFSKT